MKKKRYSEEQVAFALRLADSGVPVAEICRKMGVSEATFYRWKKKSQGMGVAELLRLRQSGPIARWAILHQMNSPKSTEISADFRSLIGPKRASAPALRPDGTDT